MQCAFGSASISSQQNFFGASFGLPREVLDASNYAKDGVLLPFDKIFKEENERRFWLDFWSCRPIEPLQNIYGIVGRKSGGMLLAEMESQRRWW